MTQEFEKTPLEKLLAAMDQGGDFPALSRTINEINMPSATRTAVPTG
jgi:hypothetical protein